MAHAKPDSDGASLAPSSPAPAMPSAVATRRPSYYVMSPAHSHHSLSTTPGASPVHHYSYAPFAVHQYPRESYAGGEWHRLRRGMDDATDDADGDEEDPDGRLAKVRVYACVALAFAAAFMLFALALWAASRSYKPVVFVKSVEYESYHIQEGTDITGVPTKMMTLNVTVKVSFRNPATFFGVHVSSTPLQLHYSDLLVASGAMHEFYQPRKSGRVLTVAVAGKQVPLYGGGSALRSENGFAGRDPAGPAAVPLRLAFVMRARAHVLGVLVKSKFYRRVGCNLLLRESRLRRPVAAACDYADDR